jgi:hypothetical protein
MMNKLISVCTLLGLFAGPLAAIEAPPAKDLEYPIKVSDKLTIIGAQFGLFTLKPDGTVDTFTPMEEIPLVEGQNFGWYLEVDTKEETVTVKDTIVLPQPPANWVGGGHAFEIGKNAASAVAEVTVRVDHGKIAKPWFFTKGDPLGEHSASTHIGNVLVFKKTFQVVPPKTP